MVVEIEAEHILANYFFHNPRKSIDTRTLKHIRNNIYKNSESSLHIDISNRATICAVRCYSYLFDWDKNNTDNIVRAQDSDKHYTSQHLSYFNNGLPSDVIKAIEKSCQN